MDSSKKNVKITEINLEEIPPLLGENDQEANTSKVEELSEEKASNNQIKWTKIWSELKSFQAPWKVKDLKKFGKDFGLALFFLICCFYELMGYALVAESFLFGNDYIRNVKNRTEYENNEKCTDFKLIGKNTYVDYENDNQTEETFRIECDEKDVFFGSFVTAFIFVPGLALSVILATQLCNCQKPKEVMLLTLALPFLIPTFPIVFILVKIISLFHHQEEWKKLNNLVTSCQGQFGSFRQLGLHIFVIFLTVNTTRHPSLVQLVAIPPSVIMVLMGQAKSWYANQPEQSLMEDIKRKVFVLPLLVAWDFVLIGAGIVICIVDFTMFMITMVSFLVFFRVLGIVSTKCLKLKTKEQKSWFMFLKLILIAFWSMCNMIWTLATYEDPENVVIIHTFAKITIFAILVFAVMLFIVRSKIKKELTSDAFWAPTKI